MAIYRLEVKPISRGSGKSIVAAAAYRSAQELINPRDGMVHDYSRRSGVEHEQLVGWEGSRQELWGRTEEIETRKNARLGVETIVSLPHELDAESRRHLAASFAQELAAVYRAPVDFAVHAPHEKGDERNHHAHILVGCRQSDGRELGERVVPFNGPEEVERWRGRWAELCNERLLEHGLEQRVDHRTLATQREAALDRGDERAAQALDRDPEPKVGSAAMALERRGVVTDRGDRLRETLALNAERGRLWEQVREFGQQVGRGIAELAERLKESFMAKREAAQELERTAERLKALAQEKYHMLPFEREAAALEAQMKRVAEARAATRSANIEHGAEVLKRRQERGQGVTRVDLANALAKNAGVRPPGEPTLGALRLVTELKSLSRAAPQPGVEGPTATRGPRRDHGPER